MKVVFNAMEDIVSQKLEEMLNSMDDCCKCEKCVTDMLAISLNRIQPKYVSTSAGTVLSKVDTLDVQTMVDMVTKIESAITLVKNNPNHD